MSWTFTLKILLCDVVRGHLSFIPANIMSLRLKYDSLDSYYLCIHNFEKLFFA